jgi:hypothetical protein
MTATGASAQNLLENPGFEDGVQGWGAPGWIGFGNVYTEHINPGAGFYPRTGVNLMSMFGNWSWPWNVSGMFQEFPTMPGETWEMSCYSRHSWADPMGGVGLPFDNWAVMKIAWFDAGGAEIGGVETTILDGTYPTDEWFFNEIAAVAPAGAVKLQALLLYIQPDVDGGACHVDDVELLNTTPIAEVDLDPDTLNKKSKGNYATCYIEAPEGYDVTEIDVSTLMLEGVIPAQLSPTEIGDYDMDGTPDLMVKFLRSALIAVCSDDGESLWLGEGEMPFDHGEEFELTVSGQFVTGEFFKGSDVIRVINPGDGSDDAVVLDVFFTPETGTARINYELPADGAVNMRVFDAAGRLVKTLVGTQKPAGAHEIVWDRSTNNGTRAGAGVYFIKLEQGGRTSLGKLLLVN